MELLRRVGRIFAFSVGLAVALYGAWLLIVNVVDVRYSDALLAWILISGALGVIGGSLYLLSLDGPDRFRTRPRRVLGWLAMLASVTLPTSLSFLLLPMVVLLTPTLLLPPALSGDQREKPATSP